MHEETIIINPPNTGPQIRQVWAFVSRDADGHENACGAIMGALGWQPLITGNPKTFEMMKPYARRLVQNPVSGKTIHLITFTTREEIEEW